MSCSVLVLVYRDKYHRLKVDKASTPADTTIQGQHISPPQVYPEETNTTKLPPYNPYDPSAIGNIQGSDEPSSPSYPASPTSDETSALLDKPQT